MSKGYNNDDYDFGTDPEFEKKFLMNIERVLSDVDKDISMDQSPDRFRSYFKGAG